MNENLGNEFILNPNTNRYISRTGSVYKKLYKQGVFKTVVPVGEIKRKSRPDVSLRMQNRFREKKGLPLLKELPKDWVPKTKKPQRLFVDSGEESKIKYKQPEKNDFSEKDAKLNAICLDIVNKNKKNFTGMNELESAIELKRLLKERLKKKALDKIDKHPVRKIVKKKEKEKKEEDESESGFPETCTESD